MAGQRAALAASSQGESGEYKPGAILRIRMNNFLTYADAEARPGPNLNVVVGPNGSGKSTILCAIALGLGATPKLLERGDSLSGFVMRDKERGWVEIELKGQEEGKNHIIRRDMDRSNNQSTWRYNGQPATQAKIKQLAEDLGIQVTNLCTFLPQEKVGKFTELNNQQLLIETELALSTTTLHADHQKLIKLQSESHTQDKTKAAAEKELEKLTEANRQLEADKRKMEERQKHLEEAMVLKKAKKWLVFQEARVKAVELQSEKKVLEEQMVAAQNVLEPYREKAAALQKEMKESDVALRKVADRQVKAEAAHKDVLASVEGLDAAVQEAAVQLSDLDRQRQQKMAAKQRAEEEVQKLKKQRDEFDPEKAKEELSRIKQQQRETNQSKMQLQELKEKETSQLLNSQREVQEAEQTLKRLQDHGRQRFEAFKNAQYIRGARDACDMRQWVNENRAIFSGRVFGPVALEISVTEKDMAAAVEQQIGASAFVSFVVENNKDRDILLKEWRDTRKKRPSVTVLGNNWQQELRQQMYSQAELEKLKAEDGIQGVMQDFIDGPKQVLAVLAGQHMTARVLVGNDRTEARIQTAKLLDRLCGGGSNGGGDDEYEEEGKGKGSCQVYTVVRDRNQVLTTAHTGKISRYDHSMQSSTQSLKPARILGQGPGTDVEARVQQAQQRIATLKQALPELQKSVQGISQKLEKLQHDLANSTREAANYSGLLKNKKGVDDKIRRMEEKVESLVRELAQDSERKKDAMRQNLRQTTQAYIAGVASSADKLARVIKALMDKTGPKLSLELSKRVHAHADNELRERAAEHRDLERQYNAKAAEYSTQKKKLKPLKEHAEASAYLEGDNTDHAVLEKTMLLNSEGRSSEWVETQIEVVEDRANSIVDNPEVIRMYQKRKAEIEQRTKELERLRGECENRQAALEKIKGPWEEKLQNVVDKLNVRFSKYMTEMSCAGEVVLDKEEADYSAWGIRIRVKFRDQNQLQDLRARVQSGGERSVSTILYLMGLQDLMGSPFRAVDEINQGMDERNERLVFSRIVANAWKTQYFLITPKLLPCLTALEVPHVTVLFVFNAAGLFDYNQWDVRKLIEAARAAKRRRESGASDGADGENAGRSGVDVKRIRV